jgi:hypothetical protein
MRADERGLEVSLMASVRMKLFRGKIRYYSAQAAVFELKLSQASDLVGFHAPVLRSPRVVGLLCTATRPHRLGNRFALCRYDSNLAQLGDDLLRLGSLSHSILQCAEAFI